MNDRADGSTPLVWRAGVTVQRRTEGRLSLSTCQPETRLTPPREPGPAPFGAGLALWLEGRAPSALPRPSSEPLAWS